MKTILVTGANGFVGSELMGRLLTDESLMIYALVRSEKKFNSNSERITLVKADLLDETTFQDLPEIDFAYYLVHGMGSENANFEHEEAQAAVNFVKWMKRVKCKSIMYLGALGEDQAPSPHLRSRHLTGEILALSKIPCLEFRASIVLAAKSTSFEMIKALCERLPIIPDLKILNSLCQPIDLDDLMLYLVSALKLNFKKSFKIEIGGKNVLTYGELLQLYGETSGKIKRKVKLPNIDDRIMKILLDFLIPEMANVGKKLFESLEFPTRVTHLEAKIFFPEIEPQSVSLAMKKAVALSISVYPPFKANQQTFRMLEQALSHQQRLLLRFLLK